MNIKSIIAPEFQWTKWTIPKLKDGKIDHNALTGNDLVNFVNNKLSLSEKNKSHAENANPMQKMQIPLNLKFGEIFSEAKNKTTRGSDTFP